VYDLGQSGERLTVEAVSKGYAQEVRARTFPRLDHVYGMRKRGRVCKILPL
jgi:ketopantoate hydroxymethyltransferase